MRLVPLLSGGVRSVVEAEVVAVVEAASVGMSDGELLLDSRDCMTEREVSHLAYGRRG